MTFSKHVVSMGADVEVFLKEKKTRRLASAIGLIGGTKEEPRWVRDGNLQEDNVLAEFAINPAVNEHQFVGNIASVLSSLEDALPGHTLEIDSVKHMLPRHVAHPKAQEFGCDPDWDAWAMCERNPPDVKDTVTKQGRHIRTAGGHIHLGIEGIKEYDVAAKLMIARSLDAFVGIPIREADPKTKIRDRVYGGLGAVRVKPYGLEYRTPSNIWIKEEDYVHWMVRNCVKAVEFLFSGKRSRLFETLVSGRTHIRGDVLKRYAQEVGMEPFPSVEKQKKEISLNSNVTTSSGSNFTDVRMDVG